MNIHILVRGGLLLTWNYLSIHKSLMIHQYRHRHVMFLCAVPICGLISLEDVHSNQHTYKRVSMYLWLAQSDK